MNPEQLQERLRDFLNGEYHAYFFTDDEAVIGYALVRHTSDPLYLRQFFIDREYRRQKYGKQAFQVLIHI